MRLRKRDANARDTHDSGATRALRVARCSSSRSSSSALSCSGFPQDVLQAGGIRRGKGRLWTNGTTGAVSKSTGSLVLVYGERCVTLSELRVAE
ncbi:hypothetical protein MRX96_013013 [Rhipicephalus microplus]